ncbi:Chemotaxis protein CheY [uncultured archaeon]|nr:Chemotaxis protein CheY [uncultured archaeon]
MIYWVNHNNNVIKLINMTKILVVEDNPLNMELVVEILKSKGFNVKTAEDGEEALRKTEIEVYDLILMDIELPGIDGVEVTKIIREKNKYVPIIALTSYAMKGDRERFLSAGFDDYISKPLDVTEFICKVENYCKAAG